MEEVPGSRWFKESRHKVGDYYDVKFSAHYPPASLEVSGPLKHSLVTQTPQLSLPCTMSVRTRRLKTDLSNRQIREYEGHRGNKTAALF